MKSPLRLKLLMAGVASLLGLSTIAPHPAQAFSFTPQIVNLEARNPDNAVTLNLEPGDYDVTHIGIAEGGLYDAWNAWGGATTGCDAQGSQCSRGWGFSYFLFVNDQPGIPLGYGNLFATPTQAQQNSAKGNTSFTLADQGTAKFFIPDNPYPDNLGGVSLKVDKRVSASAVPEPTTMLGMALAGGGLAYLKRRKR